MTSLPSEIKNAREKLDDFEKTPFPRKIKRTRCFISAFKDLNIYIMDHPDNTQVKEVVENLKKTSIRRIIEEIQYYILHDIDFSGWLDLMIIFVKEKEITNEVLDKMESSKAEIMKSYRSFVFKHDFRKEKLDAILSSLFLDRRDVIDLQNVVSEWGTQLDSILKRFSSE